MDAREVALLTLNACERQGGWSDGVLKKQIAAAGLDSRDAGLATQLCFGVIQNRILLDFYLSKFSNIPLRRLEGKVLQALRLGLYQMLFLTRIPPQRGGGPVGGPHPGPLQESPGPRHGERHPAESGAQPGPPAHHSRGRPGGVLRHPVQPPGVAGAGAAGDPGQRGGRRPFSRPTTAQPPITAMVNTVKTDLEGALEALQAEGVHGEPHPWLKKLPGPLPAAAVWRSWTPSRTASFTSRTPPPGWRYWPWTRSRGTGVLDMCAAPRGKVP